MKNTIQEFLQININELSMFATWNSEMHLQYNQLNVNTVWRHLRTSRCIELAAQVLVWHKHETTLSFSKQNQICQAHVWFGKINVDFFLFLSHIQYIESNTCRDILMATIVTRMFVLKLLPFCVACKMGQNLKMARADYPNWMIYRVHLSIKSTKPFLFRWAWISLKSDLR